MARRADVDSEELAASVRGAENAVRVIRDIRDGGNAIQKIDASLEKARKLQREHFRRERRIAVLRRWPRSPVGAALADVDMTWYQEG